MEDKRKKLVKRILLTVIANIILGLGTGLLRLSGYGTDPFTCMNLGVSQHLPVNYGTYQMLVNIFLFIPVFILDRKSFGVGALVNMLALGYFVEMWVFFFALLGITIDGMSGNLIARLLLLPIGVSVICFGVPLYMACDLGAAPYDRLGVIIETYSRGKIKFKWARIGLDLFSMGVGFVSGSVIGVGTIVIAFFTGPVVSFFRDGIVARIMKNL